MRDPGLDQHIWETEWEDLQPLVHDSPGEALPALDDLIARMMVENGYPVNGRADEAAEPEVMAEFLEARAVAERVDRGEDVDPSDVGAAVGGYASLYRHLMRRYDVDI